MTWHTLCSKKHPFYTLKKYYEMTNQQLRQEFNQNIGNVLKIIDHKRIIRYPATSIKWQPYNSNLKKYLAYLIRMNMFYAQSYQQ